MSIKLFSVSLEMFMRISVLLKKFNGCLNLLYRQSLKYVNYINYEHSFDSVYCYFFFFVFVFSQGMLLK